MVRRELDGFELVSSTEPKEPGADFYEPAILVRRLDSQQAWTHTHFAVSQNVMERTIEEAQRLADEWVKQIESVTHRGDEWDIR